MLLDVTEAADILQVSEKQVYQWIKKDQLPACRINETFRLNKVELLEWATEHQIRLSPDVFMSPDPFDEPLPRLSDALARGGIHYDITGTNKKAVLQNVVDTFSLPSSVDRDFLLQVLLAREALGTTAIGNGIAIPHVRNPILIHIPNAAINLCFLHNPIDFSAPDGKPVTILFTLLSPSVQIHLHLLSRLAFSLRESHFRSVVERQGRPEEIIDTLQVLETSKKSKPGG